MSRVRTWLVSDKQFLKYYRVFTRRFSDRCRPCLFSSALNPINFSSYLSFLFSNQNKRNATTSSASSALRVPPTGGTLSFDEQKHICFFEMEKIPARYREGLVAFLDKHRPRIYLCSIFSPKSFSFGLAEKSDFYFIKKRSWRPVAFQINSVFTRLEHRQAILPELSPRFSLQEKLVLRIFWRFRRRFLSLDDLSAYAYGRRMPRNLHASEVAVYELRDKLKSLTGITAAINRIKNFGYRMEDRVWEELLK
jgi:hypothetical protein